MAVYNKLVRDKIVEMIQAQGEPVTYHTADDVEFETKLLEKLSEEVAEFREARSEEEMADIFEVITTLLSLYGWDLEHIVKLQREKRDARGAFTKRIILEES